MGRCIQSRGGTVVAEELAPFLDLKRGQLAADRGKLTGACSAGQRLCWAASMGWVNGQHASSPHLNAPCLPDAPMLATRAPAVDESYMLPVLARFNGSPEVDDAGNIRYTFPDLQQTAQVGWPCLLACLCPLTVLAWRLCMLARELQARPADPTMARPLRAGRLVAAVARRRSCGVALGADGGIGGAEAGRDCAGRRQRGGSGGAVVPAG